MIGTDPRSDFLTNEMCNINNAHSRGEIAAAVLRERLHCVKECVV